MTETLWDAPNQQVVRADQSPPWEEGSGGVEAAPKTDLLDEMTKQELLDRANELGLDVDAAMNKADIKAAIQAAG